MELSEQPQSQENVKPNPYNQREQIETTKKPSEDRIVLLTDGIFAIALTLLVLDIRVPKTNSLEVFNKALSEEFFTNTIYYVITFAVLISYWQGHRRLMNMIERIDNTFVGINILFLAFVAFFPVTNSLLNNSQFPVAVIIYTIVLAGCGYSASLLWAYALKNHRLFAPEVDIKEHTHRILLITSYPTFFLLSLVILLIPNFPPGRIFYIWILLPVIYVLASKVIQSYAWRPTQQNL
ncbi:hypothetical protein KDA_49190 [Dictyobacter alpinus]|uniref:DUF1211 domain-containing membrane protein n=1 Tax=Dictyobacter alpinus TaxID=2014873 RepID=A0A402BDK4_9CHLR|nr:TMEM175 family protein [Dictyobacter alpinus]GCE29435.1 hypothetical protein KDA_49190 [Dictyobacter alpinus]